MGLGLLKSFFHMAVAVLGAKVRGKFFIDLNVAESATIGLALPEYAAVSATGNWNMWRFEIN